jgi:diguanylate cyclase (GGDEF)-like protein
MYKQIINIINIGIVIIDSTYRVLEWNRWMEIQSGIKKENIINSSIFNHYPLLSSTSFTRGCKAVLKFGNIVFLSQKLHNYLFPFKTTGSHSNNFEFMQQSCSMAPVREDDGTIAGILITVQDVTETVFMEKSLKKMNLLDSLTGIYNRRHMDKRLMEEFIRHKRYGRSMSIIMIDIDHFKNINDSFGHQFGDKVLKIVSGICSSKMRGGDIMSRYGGEEFCSILPETDIRGAQSLAERLREKVAETPIAYNDEISVNVTISLGLAELNEKTKTTEDLIRNADTALYQSKQNGRNMASVYME